MTTHNLATLAGPVGIAPMQGWRRLGVAAFTEVCGEVDRLVANPHPLRTVKDAAYGWRQMMAYLSLCSAEEARQARAEIATVLAERPSTTQRRLGFAIAGLDGALDGAVPEPTDRLLGWTTRRHGLMASDDRW